MSLNREHSTAQRNPPCTKQQTPPHKAANKYVPIRVRINIIMYVHTCCVPFVFLGVLSSWHLQLACLHLKCICLAFQSMLLHERAQRAEPLYRYTAAAVQQLCVRVCMLSLNREHSKAQHSTIAQSPLHKAAYNQVRAGQSTYQKKYVRTCMLRPVCFPGAWSSWHLYVACLHLKC